MNILNNYLKKYAFFIFIALTFIIMIFRVPFWDETHSLEVAMCSLKEIFYLTRIEVHPILWFLILKPFSSLKLYPYSMYLINWLFCVASIYILFKKAHFSYLIKTLIAFSTPFLFYFAPVSRCYSIGIFFIFLICAYYPVRFKRPYLFSSFIILASQTSIIAMIGAFYIGLIYLFELIKRYKKNIFSEKKPYIVIVLFLMTLIFTILEFIGLQSHGDILTYYAFKHIFDFIVIPKGINLLASGLRISFILLFYPILYFLFRYSKKGLFFISSTYLTMTLMFVFVNIGNYWNYYFYYIYLIVLFWIFGKKLLKNNFIYCVCILNLFFMLFPVAVQNGPIKYTYSSKSKQIAEYILSKPEYINAKLYTLQWWNDISPGADIYLKRNGIKLYNRYNIERGSFEDSRRIFKLRHEALSIDEFMAVVPDNFYVLADNNFLNQKFKSCFVEKKPNDDVVFRTKRNAYTFKIIDKNANVGLIVYKVIKM